MILVKQGVVFTQLKPQIYIILPLLDAAFEAVGRPCVITSAEDGKHMKTSFHYKGLALDLRSQHLSNEQQKLDILSLLRQGLGDKYDVILERIGRPSEHYHLEYDPR